MKDRSAETYGEGGWSAVDRFGIWLSQRAIRRWLPPGNSLELLELGCGFRAVQLLAVRDRLKRGTGVDFRIAPELLEKGNLSFHQGSIESILPGLADASYDVVLLNSVLEHLQDPLAVLLGARRVLRPGGTLLVNVPTWRGKAFLEFMAFRLALSPKVEMDDHKMYYGKRDLWPLLVRAGFLPSRIHLFYHKFGLNLFAVAAASAHG